MTLTEFCYARIAEDEAQARAVEEWDGTLRAGDPYPDGSGVADQDDFPQYPWGQSEADTEFFAGAGHPARVLAECEAKRAIVAIHQPTFFTDASLGIYDETVCLVCHHVLDWEERDYPTVQVPYPCRTIRALVGVDADHEDYRQEWKLDG